MTVYRPNDRASYEYDFWFRGRRYRGSTHQIRKDLADAVESDLKRRLREQVAGVPMAPSDTPRFQDFAETYYERASKRVARPERIDDLLRVVLRFWGAKPEREHGKIKIVAGEPYHDLCLGDVVADPYWLVKFEDWLEARGAAGQTKNQYRSVISQMFRLASSPAYRKRTGILTNPLAGIERDPQNRRTTTVTTSELRAWLSYASYHIRLALAIAALAPKLRLANVLALEWARHLDRDLRYITVHQHKTQHTSGEPLVVPISEQLRTILRNARRRNRGKYVVAYRGRPIGSIRGGLEGAAKRAGLHYSRWDGITFHTLRHSMATLLAELGEPEAVRKEVMGHARIETTQIYTHLRPAHQVGAHERLSAATPIVDLVTNPRRRASKHPIDDVGKNAGTRSESGADTQGKTGNPESSQPGQKRA